MNTVSDKLNFSERMGYAMGDFASNLFFCLFVYFTNFFYTDVYGLKPADLGMMLMLVRFYDIAVDFVVGAWGDATSSKWGKYRPFLFRYALPFAVLGSLAFYTPETDNYTFKLIYAYVTYALVMTVYSVVNIPYSALLGVLTPNVAERAKAANLRFIFAFAGNLLVQFLTIMLVVLIGGSNKDPFGWHMTATIYAVVAAGLFIYTFFFTKERVAPPVGQHSNLGKDFKMLFQNTPWIILFFIGICNLGFMSVRNGVIYYYFDRVVNMPPFQIMPGVEFELATFYFATGTISAIGALLTGSYLSKRFGKKMLYTVAMGVTAILTALSYWADPSNIAVMFTFQVVINFAAAYTASTVWAMYADTADFSEWKTGRRATGLFFSASSAAQKLGWSIGGGLTGFIMAAYGYSGELTVITPEQANGLNLLMSFIPAGLAALATFLMLFYTLDDTKMAVIEGELKARRKE